MPMRGTLRHKARVLRVRASQSVMAAAARLMATGEPTPHERQIIADLKNEGVHLTSLERLITLPGAQAVLERARELIAREPPSRSAAAWTARASSIDLSAETLLTRLPELYLLGLHERLLRLAQFYLRMPVAYHGAVLRHSFVDRDHAGPRLWHQDAEDFSVLRVVIYLNDVSSGGGPFEYIPRNLGISYKQLPTEVPMTSELMEQYVPRRLWRPCVGPTGTVIFADTAKTFHHESLQTVRERSVVMIGYSSRHPVSLSLAQAHFPVEQVRAALLRILPLHNHEYVFGWRQPLGRS